MSCLAGLWCQLSFFLTFFMGKSSCHSMLIMVFVPPGWDKRRKEREREVLFRVMSIKTDWLD